MVFYGSWSGAAMSLLIWMAFMEAMDCDMDGLYGWPWMAYEGLIGNPFMVLIWAAV